jgi:hypothetical protein
VAKNNHHFTHQQRFYLYFFSIFSPKYSNQFFASFPSPTSPPLTITLSKRVYLYHTNHLQNIYPPPINSLHRLLTFYLCWFFAEHFSHFFGFNHTIFINFISSRYIKAITTCPLKTVCFPIPFDSKLLKNDKFLQLLLTKFPLPFSHPHRLPHYIQC